MFFFFNDTATTEIYTLSLHDALPISPQGPSSSRPLRRRQRRPRAPRARQSSRVSSSLPPTPNRNLVKFPNEDSTTAQDRKSTRLNSSHSQISYAVFCLKKKNI